MLEQSFAHDLDKFLLGPIEAVEYSVNLLGTSRALGKVNRVRPVAVGALLCGCTGVLDVASLAAVLAACLASAAVA